MVDFEALIGNIKPWKRSWRAGVRDEVESSCPDSEKERRRLGLRWMLDDVRGDTSAGAKVTASARMVSVVVVVVMFIMGIGVVRGLLTDFSYEELEFSRPEVGELVSKTDYALSIETVSRQVKGFNVWILLAVTLGLQWCFLVVGVLGYWLWRRWSGSLTLLENGIEWLIRIASGGKRDAALWESLKSRVCGGRSVLGWRLTRLMQAGGVGYNVGLLFGLFGCLWFLNVGFYWETSLPQFGEESLNNVTRVMSLPIGEAFPGRQAVEMTQLGYKPDMSELTGDLIHSMPLRQQAILGWAVFFFVSLSLYGLLPRLLMWIGSWWMERRSLAKMNFQESHHRILWREITKVERGEVQSGPSDGVVILDVGGLEIATEALRPFLLQELRVNPEARFSLGTLDADGEKQALNAARDAAMGVVFLVEGWNLSPKQMGVYHAQVRSAIGEGHMIRYVMIGGDVEMRQWTSFVDGLKDSEAEVFHFLK